jgi:hypothetical protein
MNTLAIVGAAVFATVILCCTCAGIMSLFAK